jgi:hypothetical protein
VGVLLCAVDGCLWDGAVLQCMIVTVNGLCDESVFYSIVQYVGLSWHCRSKGLDRGVQVVLTLTFDCG